MAIGSLDDILIGVKASSLFFKSGGQPTHAASSFISFWTATAVPAAGTAAATSSTAGQVFDETTTGAATFTDPTGGAYSYVVNGSIVSNIAGVVLLFDRIWGCGNATPTNGAYTNPAQSSDVYRPTTGEGVELWVEITTVFSATAHTLTVTYTNSAGTGSRTGTVTIPASAPVGRMYPVTMQAGDSGVSRVTAMSGSSAPTGAFNILAMRRIAAVPVLANIPTDLSPLRTGMKPLEANTCLSLVFFNATGTSAATIIASLDFAAG
jgi:hypothetical protein